MPSAPDYATLFNVEDAVEAALKAVLTAGGVTPCFMQRENVDLPDSSIDIGVLMGGSYGNRDYAWSARGTLIVWTDRATDAPTLHGWRRGAIRALLTRVPPGHDYHPDFGEDVLPYHVINLLAHSSTDPQLDMGNDLDMSAVHYDMVISVRPGCYPEPVETP